MNYEDMSNDELNREVSKRLNYTDVHSWTTDLNLVFLLPFGWFHLENHPDYGWRAGVDLFDNHQAIQANPARAIICSWLKSNDYEKALMKKAAENCLRELLGDNN